MRRKTLAGRVAAAQTGVTLVTLAAVALGTSALMSTFLTRKTDRELTQVAARVGSLLGAGRPEMLDEAWVNREIQEIRPAMMHIEVRDQAGRLRGSGGEPLLLAEHGAECADRELVRPCGSSAGLFRVCGASAGAFTILAAAPRSTDIAARNQLIIILSVMCLVAGVLMGLMSRAITRRTLAPLSNLAMRAVAIEPGAGQRIGMRSGLLELEVLESRFDELIGRFDEALVRERRLSAQASHELRTPLTVARAEIETLAGPHADQSAPARALAALDQLSQLVDALLWFARAQERLDDHRMDVVNLADVVRAELAPRASAPPLALLRCRLPDEALVRGDERLLTRVVANLVDNATKYGAGALIEVTAVRADDRVHLSIANRASARMIDVQERIFEPFFRGRGGSEIPGFGLGLPFARAVARAHGGDLVFGLASQQVAEFVLTLPMVAWADGPDGAVRSAVPGVEGELREFGRRAGEE